MKKLILLLGMTAISFGQEKEDRTLLPWDQLRAIINEASGERAMHHVQELVPYPRVRPLSEYTGTFRESDVMVKYAKEYGFSNVEVESFPTPQKLWQPTFGELWMVEPEVRKLYDIYDVAISLAANSDSDTTTAEVIDVGIGGRVEDYAGKDVKGKIVLGSTGPGTLQRLGVFERGAVGVVSYTSLRADSYPDEILSQSVTVRNPDSTKKAGFGWSIAPRVAREIAGMLGRGQKVVLKSIIKTEWFPGELETVHATIPGDGSTDQIVGVSGHLYEGYIKQGANDDNSGCAMTLEMGRAYIRLIKEGKLPKPRRTVSFLWVPEISGTNAWLNKHPEVEKKMIADLNFDMEGLRLSTSNAFWMLHKTPDTFPSFLNDVCASVLTTIANVNYERIRYRANGYKPSLPVVSPNGSNDPFYISVEKHYGSSDHVTYMQHGIASVIFVTWPDMWYHSSMDTPDKLDPTMFKRAAVVGLGALNVLASAEDEMGMRVAGESIAKGAERMGDAQRKGLGYLADAASGADLNVAYKEARNAIHHQAEVEKNVVSSSSILFVDPKNGAKKLSVFDPLIDKRAADLTNEVEAFYKLRADQKNVSASKPEVTAAEKEAAKLVADRVAPAGGGGFGGGGGGGQAAARARLTDAERASLTKVPGHMTAELNILLTKKKSVLEIRDFLAGEFEPLAVSDLMDYLRVQEKLGSVKINPK